MACHPHSSPALLHQLASRNFVGLPPNCYGGTELDRRVQIMEAVAEHPNAGPDTLELLSRYVEWDTANTVRSRVAAHPGTPVPVLEQLLRDTDALVAQAAAGNPALPPATLAMWQLTR